ncbi:MAG: ferrochelatase [Campylobacteraceae bacterium]|nr:ferrochelatase [Campylobacteraceae bacterium]
MKRAVILLNMGGARNKDELAEFLKNMFLDKRIINSPARFFISFFISHLRTPKVWKDYEKIGGSKIYEHTQKLIDKLNALSSGSYDAFFAMRYTKPNIAQVLKDKNYDEVLLFPLYPHFSSTTTLSSFDDADLFFKDKNSKIKKISYFFENEQFNKTIITSIKNCYRKGAHLIFSAHSLPLSIAKYDLYPTHIKQHVEILSQMLFHEGLTFKKIHLAYQSKLGPVKWLEPNIGNVLRSLSGETVIVYPLSFTIENSETAFELELYYANIAKNYGLTSYEVCKVQNSSDAFAKFIDKKTKESF